MSRYFPKISREVITHISLASSGFLFVAVHLLTYDSFNPINEPMSYYGYSNGWSADTFHLMLLCQSVYFFSFSPTYKYYSKRIYYLSLITAVGPLMVTLFPRGNWHLFGVSWLFAGMLIQIFYIKYRMHIQVPEGRLQLLINSLFWIMLSSLVSFLLIEMIFGWETSRGITQRVFLLSSMSWLSIFTFYIQKSLKTMSQEE